MKLQPVVRLMIAACVAVVGSVAGRAPEGAPAQPLNALVISIDDLNDYAGCLGGHPDARTPNLDRFAKQGVLFTRAYCNAPVCNPSRASIWTGLRPTTTGIVSNPSGWFRDRPGFETIVTLPQALASAGYTTTAFGKIFHMGHGNSTVGELQSFNAYGYGPYQKTKLNYPMGDKLTDWGVPAGDDEPAASFDMIVADRTIQMLNDRHSQPFFLGCGLFRPHTPLYAAQRWFDLHPLDRIRLPKTMPNDTDDLVVFGKLPRREQDIEAPGLFTQDWVEETGNWKPLVQAYLASTSSMDHQLGRVLDALDKSPYRDTTLVIIFSDHGWHLGEKRHWGKAALWEKTTRVPFIVAGPGIPRGARVDRPVDLLSIYPTVMDYAGLAAPHALEGVSLRPLLENADADWDRPVLTTFVDHHALRTDRWRYIRYAGGGEELYDHAVDPDEFENLAVTRADDGEIRSALADLRLRLATLLPPAPDA